MLVFKDDLQYDKNVGEAFKLFYVQDEYSEISEKCFKTKEDSYKLVKELKDKDFSYILFDLKTNFIVLEGGLLFWNKSSCSNWKFEISDALHKMDWTDERFKETLIQIATQISRTSEIYIRHCLGGKIGDSLIEWAKNILLICGEPEYTFQKLILVTMPLHAILN